MKNEKGNWKAQNTKAILSSVRRVFEKRSIEYLTKAAYQHIIAHMGFIAHYDLGGFQSIYADLAVFAEALLTSEYSKDEQYNIKDADRYIRDDYFVKEYGQTYCQSVVDCNAGICEIALQNKIACMVESQQAFEKSERAELARLQKKYV